MNAAPSVPSSSSSSSINQPHPEQASAPAHLAAAREAHQQGDMARAEQGYRRALARDPNLPLVHLGLAFVLMQTERHGEAETVALRAVQRFPDNGELWNLLGHIHSQRDQSERAAAAFRRAIEVSPNLGLAWANLGSLELASGNLNAAVAVLSRAQTLLPNHEATLRDLAMAHAQDGNLDAAEVVLNQRLAAHPRLADTYELLGRVHRLRGANDKAAALLETALALGQQSAQTQALLGDCYRQLQRYRPALEAYLASLALNPAAQRVRYMAAEMHQQLGENDEALNGYRSVDASADEELAAELQISLALALGRAGRVMESEALLVQRFIAAPESERAASALAKFYESEGRILDAQPYLIKAAREHPLSAQAQHNLGLFYVRTNQPRLAQERIEQAIDLSPDYQLAHQNLAMLQLRQMDLPQGWRSYAWRNYRFKVEGGLPGWRPLPMVLPMDLHGQHVELIGEQGLGDELFFLRWLPQLKARGATVTYRVLTRKLTPIVAGLAGIDHISHGPLQGEQISFKLLVGDLPAALQSADAASPAYRSDGAARVDWPACPPPAALSLDKDRAERLRRQWLEPMGARPKIGLAWRGGTQQDKFTSNIDLLLSKEVPLEPLLDLLAGLDIDIVVLQRKPREDELALLAERLPHPFLDASDMDEDLQDTLALLAGLDGLVGVSNTNVHLLAGIGGRGEVLVPYPPDFRWPEATADSPWFPTFGVHRQVWGEGWAPALASLHTALNARYPAL